MLSIILVCFFQYFYRDSAEKKNWNNFVQSVRAKLTVKSVVDGVRGSAECSFDYLLLVLTAEYVKIICTLNIWLQVVLYRARVAQSV
jgi:hypothetical protein